MSKILKIRNIKKTYHTKLEETLAISNISFDLEEGDFVAIVGPSGCGKSTILNILCGLDKDYKGSVDIKCDKSIGYMLQNDALFNFRTILSNCLLGLEIQNKLNEENKEYVIKLLEMYGLKEFINSYPTSLSGGMKQRAALIRTLATKPDIILLDEPFSALDYQTRLSVSDDVYKIIKNEKKSAIMVTHDIAEAISLANKVIVLTNRPCTIKNIYDINLSNRSTPIENRKAKEFSYYYDMIWKDIDAHV